MSIVIIDDQLGVRDSLHQRAFLRAYGSLGYEFQFVSCATPSGYDAQEAVVCVKANPKVELVLLDIKFGSEDNRLGYDILAKLSAHFPSIPVLMLSSVDRDVESLGKCLENGAIGFVSKDLPTRDLRDAIDRALLMSKSHFLLGHSQPLRELRRQAARLSPYGEIPVMIVGERGTGKERVARHIHHNGPRHQGPFVPVNCAALPESLLEAELFGAEQGAYTGSSRTRPGYLERADGGILFLDEVGNAPVSTQAKLLRALQDKSFRRLGVSEQEVTIDFQVICATNVDPAVLIGQGRLREDFYERIAAFVIRTPALRECRSDIPELVSHFLRELGVLEQKTVSRGAFMAFHAYHWPGNVRELKQVVQQAVVLSEQARLIDLQHLPDRLRSSPSMSAACDRVVDGLQESRLPQDPAQWPEERLREELLLCVEAKRRVQQYKGKQWKAEFMRKMYPECKASNAKGFADLIRRLAQGPWGSVNIRHSSTLASLLHELER